LLGFGDEGKVGTERSPRPMIAPIERHRAEIGALCQRHNVRRLDLFGSAARETDFTATSDVDLLVEFDDQRGEPSFHDFLEFREALSRIIGRHVDLTMSGAVRNPYLRAAIERSRLSIHGA
jgi:predicted nucleotidyltransferase